LSQASSNAASGVTSVKRKPRSIGGKHHFLLRRLHSLTGIVPVGVFVIFHLFTNMQLAFGTFQHEVEWIHSLPALYIMELVLWLSIGFHAALGLVYTFAGAKPNATRYGYFDNWRYTLQRVSGILALLFIFLHVATLRWRWDIFGWFTPFYVEGPNGEPLATATTAMALQYAWWVVAIYIVGALSVIYHWSNGLWTAAITWGLTISARAQHRWKGVCAVLGIALTVFFAAAIIGALRYDVSEAEVKATQAAAAEREAGGAAAHQPGDANGEGGAGTTGPDPEDYEIDLHTE